MLSQRFEFGLFTTDIWRVPVADSIAQCVKEQGGEKPNGELEKVQILQRDFNGFSLVRHILKKKNNSYLPPHIKKELIKPTKIYVKEVNKLVQKKLING